MQALQDAELDRLARKRAGAKLGFYIHATIYVLVNLLLAGLSAASGRHWAVFPALGWGIGLAAHALIVYFVSGNTFEQLVQRERDQLAARHEPW